MCCVCTFSLRQESPDMILGDKPLFLEVVLSQSLPFRLRKCIERRFIRAQTFVILAFLVARLNPTHWALRICHLLLENWMHVKY
jgi:hypothetical protein